MIDQTDSDLEIAHLKADLARAVKDRDIFQKQLGSRLLPVHICLVIIAYLLLFTSMFAAYEWIEADRLQRLLEQPVEHKEN